jgi:hypothetical protein
MSDEEDIDLLAMQRRLDDAFETTRPRRGFEDELWLRIQTRRPFWQRLQDGFAGLVEGLRELPAVPATALAAVLIVAIGIGLLAQSGFRFHFGGASTATSTSALPPGSNFAMAPSSFGRLPSVALYPGVPFPPRTGSPYPADATQPSPAPIPANLYFGPATLSWTGQFPAALGPALVYRYHEPSVAQADQFAVSLGAAPMKVTGTLPPDQHVYEGQAFTLSVSLSLSVPPRDPQFYLGSSSSTTTPSGAASGNEPKAAGTTFLAMHSLLPAWSYTVALIPFSDPNSPGNWVRVQFLREFQLPTGEVAYFVNSLGNRHGTEVLVRDGLPEFADGPLPLSLDSASYPLIAESQAIQQAVASPAAGSQVINPQPDVQLDKVELVYALAFSGAQGFYEPAYLFSGTFQYQGQTMEKRVLVPAVDPSQLNS